ncbi:hypothetical protein GL325_05520 [Aeromicrobium sp. 636]|uniref:Uncharacterized protein n=1 Tax=Aeromicrobium senzhongii TaxID=2663859 RepID=A0A8I0K252_9ACTN|nr:MULTISPECIES: hypothetical protein [Aeromicrobium]MBC9225774.1 hypothetical protein [Aeromicrobium senzhongii]MCQ3997883.1 hypothetical protein [Aeromicrobium sp. 636]MTB87811.1 hypothetical protein [Aeromicrobium senzhongii]QNL95166.1 hypothetical protein H9L21_04290 [Aeromicrobium senzhongii]
MDLITSLERLAEQNLSGVAFLTAYGVTWVACGLLWRRTTEQVATYATLFQGLFALPAALGLSALIGAIGPDRPVGDEITQLSVLIGTSQLLGLPLLIVLVVRHQYRLVPFTFAAITSMHFVLYAWLYRTPVYIAMAVMISLGTMVVTLTAPEESRSSPARVCFLTGGLLLTTALLFLVHHRG